MTLKEFVEWCNQRACDGCWGSKDAIFCIELIENMRRIPFWKRKKVWNTIKDKVEYAVINPINQKIQELYAAGGGMTDGK